MHDQRIAELREKTQAGAIGLGEVTDLIDELATVPAWHDWPDNPGLWIMDFDDGHSELRIVTEPGNEPSDRRWYGPIPTDPMRTE